MPSSSDEATPPQGPEIWSVPFVPNSEIAHNTMVEKMSSSSDGATPPQGPEIWSVPLDPNSEIAYNTVVDECDVTSVLFCSEEEVECVFCQIVGRHGSW